MNNQHDILRLLRNLIRIGTVSAVDLDNGLCRVETGGNLTDWLNWLTCRAGRTRSWSAPSVGEQVLIFALGGELDTAFVLCGIFSDYFPARLRRRMRCTSRSRMVRSSSMNRKPAS